VFATPPHATWFRGRAAIAEFLRADPMGKGNRWRQVPTRANGQLTFGHYVWFENRGAFGAHAIDVLTLDGDRIAEVNVFMDPEAFARFGLPRRACRGGPTRQLTLIREHAVAADRASRLALVPEEARGC
jgi:hypothetical protein